MYKREGYRNPIPTTDVIIEYKRHGKEGIVLVERKNYPYGFALPGGFAEWGISYPENAKKEAKEETNLDIILLHDEDKPFLVLSSPDRDPRGHMISNTYLARGYGNLKGGDDAKAAYLFSISEVKQLIADDRIAFDHPAILESYFQHKGVYQ